MIIDKLIQIILNLTTSYQISSSDTGAVEGKMSRGLSIPFSILISVAAAGGAGCEDSGGSDLSSSSRSTGPSGGISLSAGSPFQSLASEKYLIMFYVSI